MSDRPPVTDIKCKLLDALSDLRHRIIKHQDGEPESDMLRRYDYFVQNASFGRDCQYAKKTMALFFLYDYPEISTLIKQAYEIVLEFESKLNKGDL